MTSTRRAERGVHQQGRAHRYTYQYTVGVGRKRNTHKPWTWGRPAAPATEERRTRACTRLCYPAVGAPTDVGPHCQWPLAWASVIADSRRLRDLATSRKYSDDLRAEDAARNERCARQRFEASVHHRRAKASQEQRHDPSDMTPHVGSGRSPEPWANGIGGTFVTTRGLASISTLGSIFHAHRRSPRAAAHRSRFRGSRLYNLPLGVRFDQSASGTM
jgi:hypothetical protein